ncbi:MAG: hypothetical protein OEY23_19075 [Acidimicrobiia bacterium]|nr:hypothetical protein [Acidimicrobiia bacterium]
MARTGRFTERVTRFSTPVTMPNGYSAEDTLAGLCAGLDQVPGHLLKSITFDQRSEWAQWELLAAEYDIDVWFCEPHSPWQRGQVENLNRQWRWWASSTGHRDSVMVDVVGG